MLQQRPRQKDSSLQLIVPDLAHLDGYADALRRGWSPDNVRLDAAAREELARIEADPAAFVASLDDPEAKGGDIPLPDGTMVRRLPGFRRWMWDGEFCGSVFAGSPAQPRCPPMSWGISATPSCRGSAGMAMRPGHSV